MWQRGQSCLIRYAAGSHSGLIRQLHAAMHRPQDQHACRAVTSSLQPSASQGNGIPLGGGPAHVAASSRRLRTAATSAMEICGRPSRSHCLRHLAHSACAKIGHSAAL
jgi:hypothetical protein